MYINEEIIKAANDKLPEELFTLGVDLLHPFVFLDFEVFKNDWMLCYSDDGINIHSIINDSTALINYITQIWRNKILIAYNGNGYDKPIALSIINGINPKEVNDQIINGFDFNFNAVYGKQIVDGRQSLWYDPSSKLGGSLKTYEACQGEDIYESDVDFNLDRSLTQEEIEETIKYCSFDVKMLIQYFYKEKFDTFLGHLGLVLSTLKARTQYELYQLLPKTDASLVGIYLCSQFGMDMTRASDIIELPNTFQLGKYESRIKEFLQVPIKTLSKGRFNDLNSWSLNVINKSLEKCVSDDTLEKLGTKREKLINQTRKLKEELIKLKEKDKLTEKQEEKLENLPSKISEVSQKLISLNEQINIQQDAKSALNEHYNNILQCTDKQLTNYTYRKELIHILKLAKVTDNAKLELLISYLTLSDDEIHIVKYKTDKTTTPYNGILIEYPFELLLDIKGVKHAFKTGGIHSISEDYMSFDNGNDKRKLLIADVGSLYPNVMRVFGLCSIGMDDPAQYSQMIFDRIALKKKGDSFAQVLKLILNTTYGCMGSQTNMLYDPTNRLKVCIYGQCAIVDLLDKLEDKIKNLEIYQSNTDGILISCLNEEYDDTVEIIHDWENRTGLEMEIDVSVATSQRDVSNYLLIEEA